MRSVKAGKLHSKHWSLREDALKTISQTMCETEETAGRDVTLLLLKGAIVAFNRAVRDNVFAVRVYLKMYTVRHKKTHQNFFVITSTIFDRF